MAREGGGVMDYCEMQMEERKIAKELGIPVRHACIVGSTLICRSGNDLDVLCLMDSEDMLGRLGYEPDIEVAYESDLRSYRKGRVNIIATTSPEFFFAEVAIANAARLVATRKFDMKDRDHRVLFHSHVREQVLGRLHSDEIPW